jgi:PAS domain S-box-containing protein
VVLTCVDVTGRIRAEVALGESELRFCLLAELSPAMIWVIDEAGKSRYVNQAYLEFFGKPADSVPGDQWVSMVHSEDSEAYVAEVMAAVREQRPFRARTGVQRRDGQWRLIESHAIPHFTEAGKYLGHVGQSHDITDIVAAIADAEKARHEAEAAAQAKDDFFAALSHELRTPLSPVLMCAGDLEMDESLPPDVREQPAMMRRNIELAARESRDLLLSDVGLPDGTGYDLMREMKERYGWPGIALSGYGMPADARQSSEAGFGAHLVKPVNITMIRGAIHKIGLGAKKS